MVANQEEASQTLKLLSCGEGFQFVSKLGATVCNKCTAGIETHNMRTVWEARKANSLRLL